MQWIRHFDKHTKSRLNSPEEYRLLLCDGHDSHISAELCAYCLQNRIVLILLPPHSSHLLQPLDVCIFSPLKTALSQRQAQLFRSGVRRIEKAEWTEHYYAARTVAITEKNILSAWRGAGLFPENMFRVLHQLIEPSPALISTPNGISDTDTSQSLSTPFLLTSSHPDPSILHSMN
jgi:DDE superfamily endonuclease